MCNHKKLHLECADCRASVKFFNSEVDAQLHRIRGVCNKLQRLIEHSKMGTKNSEMMYDCLDVLDSAVRTINNETNCKSNNSNLCLFK